MPSAPKSKQFLTIGEAANKLGVSIDTLRRWQKAGKISAARSGGGIRLFPVEEIERLLPEVSKQASYFSVTQAATFLGVSAATLRRWDRQGKLKPVRTLSNERVYQQGQLANFAQKIANDHADVVESTTFKDKAQALSDSLFVTLFNRETFANNKTRFGILLVVVVLLGALFQQHTVIQNLALPSQTLAVQTSEPSAKNNAIGQPILVQVVPKDQASAQMLDNQQGPIELSGSSINANPNFNAGLNLPSKTTLPDPLTGQAVPELSQVTTGVGFGGITSGSGTVDKDQISSTIAAPLTTKSKVFVSQTSGKSVSLLVSKATGAFTVSRETSTDESISFDWLIIN